MCLCTLGCLFVANTQDGEMGEGCIARISSETLRNIRKVIPEIKMDKVTRLDPV